MNALVTGSAVYGQTRDDSDIDLVVLVTPADINLLRFFADNMVTKHERKESDAGPGGISASLRFGKLNLLCVTDPIQYEVWRRGTRMLKDKGVPISRELAVAMFEALREHYGLNHVEPGFDYVKGNLASKKS